MRKMPAHLVLLAISSLISSLMFAHAPTAHAAGATPLGSSKTSTTTSTTTSQGGLDSATTEALQKTQQGLTNPAERAKMIQISPQAQEQDAKVRSMLGSHTDGAYKISAGVLEKLVRETGGDATKMQAIMNQLMSNPQMLEQYLTPAERDSIRKMANDIEKKNGSTPAQGSGY